MATRVNTTIYWDRVYGMTLRADGTVREYVKDVTQEIANRGKVNLITNSKARSFGHRRTGDLGRSITARYRWANQHGCGYHITMLGYGAFVHEGTGPVITARGGKKMPIGRSQGVTTGWAREVRGQRANPFMTDAAWEVKRRRGY